MGGDPRGVRSSEPDERAHDRERGQWCDDADDDHRYQPGYLFMPFGTYKPSQVTKSRRATLNAGVDLQYGEVDVVRPKEQVVALTDGREFDYDMLIIATGVSGWLMVSDMFWGEEWLEETHEVLANLTFIAVAVHLSAVILMSKWNRKNYIQSMLP